MPSARSALAAGLLSCHQCGRLSPEPRSGGHARCARCGDALHRRKPNSIDRTWALIITAAVLYFPANLFPIMSVELLGEGDPHTIIGGVIALLDAGNYAPAIIVLFASVTVPLAKLLGLSFLLLSVQRKSSWRARDRTVLYRVIEMVGRWSMIDVFMVSILVALVNMGAIAQVVPGLGATFFASVVIVTMIAAESFDPRVIWDAAGANPGPEEIA